VTNNNNTLTPGNQPLLLDATVAPVAPAAVILASKHAAGPQLSCLCRCMGSNATQTVLCRQHSCEIHLTSIHHVHLTHRAGTALAHTHHWLGSPWPVPHPAADHCHYRCRPQHLLSAHWGLGRPDSCKHAYVAFQLLHPSGNTSLQPAHAQPLQDRLYGTVPASCSGVQLVQNQHPWTLGQLLIEIVQCNLIQNHFVSNTLLAGCVHITGIRTSQSTDQDWLSKPPSVCPVAALLHLFRLSAAPRTCMVLCSLRLMSSLSYTRRSASARLSCRPFSWA